MHLINRLRTHFPIFLRIFHNKYQVVGYYNLLTICFLIEVVHRTHQRRCVLFSWWFELCKLRRLAPFTLLVVDAEIRRLVTHWHLLDGRVGLFLQI